jgi:hypothetical protein
MRKLVTLLAAATALTACGSQAADGAANSPELPAPVADSSPAADSTPPEGSEPEPEPEGPKLNDRGNIVKEMGEEGAIMTEAGDAPWVTFTVDSVKPAECTPEWQEYGSPPENGHLVAVQMRFATTPAMAGEPGLEYFTVSGYDFNFIGSDGVTVSSLDTMATYSCLPENQLLTSDALRPGQQYRGAVVLDVPEPSGVLVYQPSSLWIDGGWEWEF